MSLATLLSEDVTLYRPTGGVRDAIGGITPTTATTTAKGYLEPLTGNEDLANRNTGVGNWRLYLEATADVDGWDTVSARDRVFEIVAPPRPILNPRTSTLSHYEVDLAEVT